MKLQRNARPLATSLALVAALSLTSCAAFNRGEITLSRHVSVGQELLDLQRAKEEGAITEAEYKRLKAKVIDILDEVDPDGWFDDSDHDHDHEHHD